MSNVNYTSQDLPLLGRAARERWPIPPQTKTKVMKVIHDILEDDHVPDLIRLQAANTLARFDQINVKHEQLYTPKLSITLDLENMSEEELFKKKEQLENMLESQRAIQELGIVTADQAFEPPLDAKKELTGDDYEMSEWKVKKTRTEPGGETKYKEVDEIRPKKQTPKKYLR